MNKTHHLSLILILCSLTTLINAYEFSFFNNTNDPIGIAIQYTSTDENPHEPLYKQLIKPHSMEPFTPGKLKIPEIKWGFCLDNMYYIKNPTPAEKAHHFEKASWRKIIPTWVEQKSTTKRTEKKEPSKEQTITPAAPNAQKSLCRNRHFDIIENEHGQISITTSIND